MKATTFTMVGVLIMGGFVAGSTPVQAFCPENPIWEGCLPDPSGIASDAEDIAGRAEDAAMAPVDFGSAAANGCAISQSPQAYCEVSWLDNDCLNAPVPCADGRIDMCFGGSHDCNTERQAWHGSVSAEATSWDNEFQSIVEDCVDGYYEHLCRFDGCPIAEAVDCLPEPHVPTWLIEPPGGQVGVPVALSGTVPVAVIGDVHLYWFNGDDDVLQGVGTESPCDVWNLLTPVVTCVEEGEPDSLFESPQNPFACLRETTLRINTDGNPQTYELNHGIVMLYTSPCEA